MKKYNKLAVFGGTFSPVHNGHIAAMKTYADIVRPDALYIIPTAIPPHKDRVDTVRDTDRLSMLQLAVSGFNTECEIVVSDIEILRGGKSYTVDTVDYLLNIANEVIIYCGTDMILTLDKWHDFDRLLKTVSVAYMQREEDLRYSDDIEAKVKQLSSIYGTRFISLPPVSDEISSSMIRQMLHDNVRIDTLVPEKVAEYIYLHRLYE